ncbi:MAG: ABC transporter permease [Ruminococcus sp.]|nr:ABC transporter permease [Ruminococcus sp.]
MFKIISSDFMRLKKDTLFWLCIAVMFIFGLVGSISMYIDKKEAGDFCAENVAFGFPMLSGILCGVFCGMFQGEEFSEGTIRNKIISGHKRRDIYISQVLVCISAGLLMCIAYIIPSLIIGMVFMGGFQELSNIEVIGYYLTGLLQISVCVTLFSLIITSVQKKTLGIALCFLVAIIIMYVSIDIHNCLVVPEYTYMFDSGTMEYGKNPRYPDDNERRILTLIFEILPAGQAYQLCYRFAENIVYMISGDIILCIIFVLSGMSVFSRKDLK